MRKPGTALPGTQECANRARFSGRHELCNSLLVAGSMENICQSWHPLRALLSEAHIGRDPAHSADTPFVTRSCD